MKMYRCGWCGSVTKQDGSFISVDELKELKYSEKDYNSAEQTHGVCCAQYEQQESNKMQVTRDMAIDAGDPSLEGQWI